MAVLTKPDWEQVDTGIKRRILNDGEKLMVVEVAFQPGSVGYIHEHPHEQSSVVVKGGGLYTLGDVDYELKEGDVIHVPSGIPHGFVAKQGEETILLDIFTPPREDFRK